MPRGTVAVASALTVAVLGALLFGLSPSLNPIDAILGRPPFVEVPDLSGLAQPRAEADLESAGLEPSVSTSFSFTEPRGSVISQDPEPGTRVRAGTEVEVVVSSGITRVEMPAAVGRPLSEVTGPLEAAGVPFTTEEIPSEEHSAGIVIRQYPEPGSVVTASDSVRFVVSSGPPPRPVPDVVRLTSDGAAYALGSAGLVVGEITETESAEEPGVVLQSEPPAGQSVPRDTEVALVVSAGLLPVAVPDIQGVTERDAIELVRGLGLVPSVVNQGLTPGTVAATDPVAGTEVPAGSVLRIQVTRE